MKNAIIYVVDNNLQNNKYLKHSIDTYIKNNNNRVDIIVLTLSSNLSYCVSENNVRRINVDEVYDKYIKNLPFKEKSHTSNFTFMKLVIPLIEQLNEYDKILYLDTDTEIKSDISNLFTLDMKNNEIGAVAESLADVHFKQLSNDVKQLDFKPMYMNIRQHKHYNAGVMLISLKNIKEKIDYKLRFNELIKMQQQCNFNNHDQDLINIGFDIIDIDKRYNVFPGDDKSIEESIVHYICHYKYILNSKIKN